MDRVRVYALIAAELDRWQTLPRSEVVERVGKPAEVSSALIDGAEVTIEVRVSWADDTQRQLRVGAAAYGPSHYLTERLEEAINLDRPSVKPSS